MAEAHITTKGDRIMHMQQFMMVGLIAVTFAFTAKADFVVQPTGATQDASFQPTRTGLKTINGSGLSDASIVETGDEEPVTWPTHNDFYEDEWWQGNNANNADAWLRLELDDSYLLTGLYLWNDANTPGGGRAIKDFDIKVSNDVVEPIDWSTVAVLDSFTAANTPSGVANVVGEKFTFTTPTPARWVMLEVNSDYGDTFGPVISEVRLLAIPEPTSLALLAMGGVMMARRRR